MTPRHLSLFFLLAALLVLSTGCQEGDHHHPRGELLSQSGCLMTVAGNQAQGAAFDVVKECLSYRSLPGGEVILMHEGAIFNCEPGEISADISVYGDSIVIREHQSQAGVHCVCPYNLEFRLSKLCGPSYHLTLHTVDQRILELDIDTDSGASDQICLDSPIP